MLLLQRLQMAYKLNNQQKGHRRLSDSVSQAAQVIIGYQWLTRVNNLPKLHPQALLHKKYFNSSSNNNLMNPKACQP